MQVIADRLTATSAVLWLSVLHETPDSHRSTNYNTKKLQTPLGYLEVNLQLCDCLYHYITLGNLNLSLTLEANDPGHVACGPSMLLMPTLDGPAITWNSALLHQNLNLLRASGP